MWILSRVIGSSETTQISSGFAAFISSTGVKPQCKSAIDYFTPIINSFTEYSTVEDLRRVSEIATAEVGQDYVLNTSDLGMCMKVLPLIWKYPSKCEKHIVSAGLFHVWMNYMNMLTGHKCKGSGYADTLVKAQLVTSVCLSSILRGKAYAKALFCLKTVTEAFERLLIQQFVEESNIELNASSSLLDLTNDCNCSTLNVCLQDEATDSIF